MRITSLLSLGKATTEK